MFGNNKRPTQAKSESFYDLDEGSAVEEEEEEEEYLQDRRLQSHAPTAHPPTNDTHAKKNWFHIPNILGGHKDEDEGSVDSMEDESVAAPADEEEQAILVLAKEASEAEYRRKQEIQKRKEAEIRRVMEESVLEEQNRQHHVAAPPHHVATTPHHMLGGQPDYHHPITHHVEHGGHGGHDPRGISPHEAEQIRYLQQMEHQQQHAVSPRANSPRGPQQQQYPPSPGHHHHGGEVGLEHHMQQMNIHHAPPPPPHHHSDVHNGSFYGSTHPFPHTSPSVGHHAGNHSNAQARDDPAGLQAAMAMLVLAQRHFDHDPLLTSIEAQRYAWELTGQWLAQASAQLQLADCSGGNSHHQVQHGQYGGGGGVGGGGHAVAAPSPAHHHYHRTAGTTPSHHQQQQPVHYQHQVPQFADVPWECPACTLMNQATFWTCAACGQPRR